MRPLDPARLVAFFAVVGVVQPAPGDDLEASSLVSELDDFATVGLCGLPIGKPYLLAKYGAVLAVDSVEWTDTSIEVGVTARGVRGGDALLREGLGFPEGSLPLRSTGGDRRRWCASLDVVAVARGPASVVSCGALRAASPSCAWRFACAPVEAGRHVVDVFVEGEGGDRDPGAVKYPMRLQAWEGGSEIKWRSSPTIPGAAVVAKRNNYDGPFVRGAPEVWCRAGKG